MNSSSRNSMSFYTSCIALVVCIIIALLNETLVRPAASSHTHKESHKAIESLKKTDYIKILSESERANLKHVVLNNQKYSKIVTDHYTFFFIFLSFLFIVVALKTQKRVVVHE